MNRPKISLAEAVLITISTVVVAINESSLREKKIRQGS